MEFSGLEQHIVQWLSTFAYHPYELYGLIVGFMLMSGFGLPIPEEIVLLSSGLIAHSGSRPDLYPPPFPGAPVVDPYVLAFVCFAAVFLSDFVVFALGRRFGQRIAKSNRFGKYVDPRKNPKLNILRRKYGVWACAVFRFTPGIRFPGHLSCGVIKIPYWKFALIDGGAALITVPTQVILVALYGEVMLGHLKQFKIVLFSILAVAAIGYFAYRAIKRLRGARAGNPLAPVAELRPANVSGAVKPGPPDNIERRTA